MGHDALILGTTRMPQRNGRNPRVEVVAASEGTASRSGVTDGKRPTPQLDERDPAITKLRETDKDVVLGLMRIQSRLRGILDKMLAPGAGTDRLFSHTAGKTLLHAGFDPSLVERRLLGYQDGMDSSMKTLVEDLVGGIRVEAGLERISVFLGSSGAGKTTTVLKVASGLLLPNGLKPNVVYFGKDDGRSVTWLKSQCRKIGVRFKKVSGTRNLEKILRKAGKTPVLVDTPGISDLTDEELRFIAEAPRVYRGMRIRLVVDSAMDPQNMCSIASCLPDPSRVSLVLTKLDEATRIGGAISMAIERRIPLAYITGGKDLDGGIYTADASLLSEKILESLEDTQR